MAQIKLNSRGIALGLIVVTTFGAGCVKNANKEARQTLTDKVVLQSEAISLNSNGVSIQDFEINQSFDQIPKNIEASYDLSINEISTLSMLQADPENGRCSGQGPFLYDFQLEDSLGRGMTLSSPEFPSYLLPGSYRLKVNIDNRSLCRDVKLTFKIELLAHSDHRLTANRDIKLQCYSTKESQNELALTRADLQSTPLEIKLTKINPANGQESKSVISGGETFCQAQLPAGLQCFEQLTPVNQLPSPLLARNHKCYADGLGRPLARADFRVEQNRGLYRAQFDCHAQGQIISQQYDNCVLKHDLGHTLGADSLKMASLRIFAMEAVMVLPMGEEVLERLPLRLYANIYIRDILGDYHPVLPGFQMVRKSDFQAQQALTFYNINRQHFLTKSLDRFKIVLSERPDKESGVLNFALNSLCDATGSSVVSIEAARTNSLCISQ